MLLNEFDNDHPFPNSQEQRMLFHGTDSKFSKFDRPAHGIFVTPIYGWAKEHYGGTIIPIYANVVKTMKVDWGHPASDAFYDRDYPAVAKFINKLAGKGYNAAEFGGESESMVLFNDIEIVNVETGKRM